MQGHVPGPPQPHFPDGLAPFIGYLATREPRPLGERPPGEPACEELDARDLHALDEFDDVGEWEPMHKPLIQAIAVVLSISLVVAGVGTVLEMLLASR